LRITQQVDEISQRIDSLEEERQELFKKFESLDRFRELLWATGQNWLEPLVQDALGILGIPCERETPKDLVHRYDDRELWIEIEGSEGPIKVAKAGQLFNYLGAEPEKADKVDCAIIGNPFRLAVPDGRPPPNAQEDLFSTPLRRVAEKQGWPLITTTQLFNLLKRHLDGDAGASIEMRTFLKLPT
jgi:hypothetical protein